MELYRKYRPDTLDGVFGQEKAVKVIKGWLKAGTVPHAILLTGPSGTGKTTLARIIAKELGAVTNFDLCEVNASADGGVAMVASICDDMRPSITGNKRVWILDEAQGISNAGQNSLLKLVEEAPDFVYFILCSTDPHKILKTLSNRCSNLVVNSLSKETVGKVISTVAEKEGVTLTDDVKSDIVSHSLGSGRKALVLLEQSLSGVEVGEAVELSEQERDLTDKINRLLFGLFNRECRWLDIMAVYREIDDDPETVRRFILAWFGYRLSGEYKLEYPLSPVQLAECIRIFQHSLMSSGKAGLLLMLFDTYKLYRGK